MDKQSMQKLISELQNGSAQQRRAASFKLGNSKDPSAVPALVNAYNDNDGSVVQNVINGLKNIGSPEALEFLNLKKASPLPSGVEINPSGEEVAATPEVTILEMRQHRGMLVLIALLAPVLFGLSAIFWSGVEDGTPFGCFWFISLGAAFYSIYLVFNNLAKRPQLTVTNKKIIGFNTGATKEGLLANITKVTVQELIQIGNNHFGNLVIHFRDKPAMRLGGLPDPINFAETLKSIGVPATKINIIYWKPVVVFALLAAILFYVYLFYALAHYLFN